MQPSMEMGSNTESNGWLQRGGSNVAEAVASPELLRCLRAQTLSLQETELGRATPFYIIPVAD
jgi:hypothetical protein